MTAAIKLSIALLALAPAVAQAEIYACPGERGIAVYQNFPCSLNSLGSVPDTAGKQRAAAPAAQPVPRESAVATVHSAGESQPTVAGAAVSRRVPAVGWLQEEVRKAWGEPEEIVQDEPRRGRVEIWRYTDGRSVEIDRRHRVVAVTF